MILDMLPILSGSLQQIDFEFSFRPSEDSLLATVYADVDFAEPIIVTGYVKNMAGYMVLSADVRVSYSTLCARCIEPVSNVLEISFEKDIASSEDVSSENDDYIIIEDKKLDLLPSVEEEIMLEMPSRTLCKEDCLGLCHKCGKNLNEGDCDCDKKEVDPRLAILKTLLQ
ncbi:MAG: DUF177 domain-containing protein [Clostridia bacterium]|nr:DUF177 domain-containing protein [Clostridia bacterium]MBR6744850.1 DUF177 domain-containing protein [Clostridia bacterium]MBR7161597.1 DUF177 domain-containing protein [Clostridia bacterium]